MSSKPFNYSAAVVNGVSLPRENQFCVSIASPSFQYGLNIFEGIRVYSNNGVLKPFLLSEHLFRLLNSANAYGISYLPSYEEMESDIDLLTSLVDEAGDYYIKYMLSYLGSGSWHSCDAPDRVALIYKANSTLLNDYFYSVAANISSIQRLSANSLPPSIKVGANYMNSRLAFLDVNKDINTDMPVMPILLDEHGFISESSGSCIIAISGNSIRTPPLYSSILPSITREHIINLLHTTIACHFEEKPLTRWDLLSSESILLVGTSIEIAFVHSIGHVQFKPNNLALQIRSAFTRSVYDF